MIHAYPITTVPLEWTIRWMSPKLTSKEMVQHLSHDKSASQSQEITMIRVKQKIESFEVQKSNVSLSLTHVKVHLHITVTQRNYFEITFWTGKCKVSIPCRLPNLFIYFAFMSNHDISYHIKTYPWPIKSWIRVRTLISPIVPVVA